MEYEKSNNISFNIDKLEWLQVGWNDDLKEQYDGMKSIAKEKKDDLKERYDDWKKWEELI